MYRRGEKVHTNKLKETEVLKIRKMLKGEIPLKEIAEKFKISISAVSSIKHKRSWHWLKDDK